MRSLAIAALLALVVAGCPEAPEEESEVTPDDAARPDLHCMPEPEVCDGQDNDCDGQLDEDGECCRSGESRQCGMERGVCFIATQHCDHFVWNPCPGLAEQGDELCDGLERPRRPTTSCVRPRMPAAHRPTPVCMRTTTAGRSTERPLGSAITLRTASTGNRHETTALGSEADCRARRSGSVRLPGGRIGVFRGVTDLIPIATTPITIMMRYGSDRGPVTIASTEDAAGRGRSGPCMAASRPSGLSTWRAMFTSGYGIAGTKTARAPLSTEVRG